MVLAPAWMLDAAICSGMELGSAQVSPIALLELHDALIELGFRRGFEGDESSKEPIDDTLECTGRGSAQSAAAAERERRTSAGSAAGVTQKEQADER